MKNILTKLTIFLTFSSVVQAAPMEGLKNCPNQQLVEKELNDALNNLKSGLARKFSVQLQVAQSRIQVGGIAGGDIQNLRLKQTPTECEYVVGDQVMFKLPRQNIK